MYKTKIGLRLRAIGDHPQAAETVGINVTLYRYINVTLCGMLAGLAGSYLSIVQNNLFVQEMVAGRGFMAIAANIFGGWNPVGSMVASLIFAFAQALRLNLSDLNIPDQFIQMLPYVLTLIVLMGVAKKAKGPEALGNIDS
jgi:simple sugar transport system permease protein